MRPGALATADLGSSGPCASELPRSFRRLRTVSLPGWVETVSCQVVDGFVGLIGVEPVDTSRAGVRRGRASQQGPPGPISSASGPDLGLGQAGDSHGPLVRVVGRVRFGGAGAAVERSARRGCCADRAGDLWVLFGRGCRWFRSGGVRLWWCRPGRRPGPALVLGRRRSSAWVEEGPDLLGLEVAERGDAVADQGGGLVHGLGGSGTPRARSPRRHPGWVPRSRTWWARGSCWSRRSLHRRRHPPRVPPGRCRSAVLPRGRPRAAIPGAHRAVRQVLRHPRRRGPCVSPGSRTWDAPHVTGLGGWRVQCAGRAPTLSRGPFMHSRRLHHTLPRWARDLLVRPLAGRGRLVRHHHLGSLPARRHRYLLGGEAISSAGEALIALGEVPLVRERPTELGQEVTAAGADIADRGQQGEVPAAPAGPAPRARDRTDAHHPGGRAVHPVAGRPAPRGGGYPDGTGPARGGPRVRPVLGRASHHSLVFRRGPRPGRLPGRRSRRDWARPLADAELARLGFPDRRPEVTSVGSDQGRSAGDVRGPPPACLVRLRWWVIGFWAVAALDAVPAADPRRSPRGGSDLKGLADGHAGDHHRAAVGRPFGFPLTAARRWCSGTPDGLSPYAQARTVVSAVGVTREPDPRLARAPRGPADHQRLRRVPRVPRDRTRPP